MAVVDLDRSAAFYREIMGIRLRARSSDGAYLEAGNLWLCLSLDAAAADRPHPDYTHIAFDVDAAGFAALTLRLDGRSKTWRDNRSEGASLYVLDPDGHRLELHVGSLASRLAGYRHKLPLGMTLYD